MLREDMIISLGGSLVVPEKIDTAFLRVFRNSVKKYTSKYNFLIFVGGGKTARSYQEAISVFGANSEEKDTIGIESSRINARIVRQAFPKISYGEIITDPTKKVKTNKKIAVGGGYRPGFSTDYVSVLAAKTYKVKTVVNLTNVDYVYDKNPNKHNGAKSIKKISWKDFRKIVGNKWVPGMNVPFDPRAAKLADKLNLKVVVINGKNTKSFENFLSSKPFKGTTIQ